MSWVSVAIASVAAPVAGQIIGGILGGTGSKSAAGQQNQGYNNATAAIDTSYGKAQDLLRNQYTLAGNSLTGGYNAGQNYLTGGYNTATGAINSNYDKAIAGFAPYQGAGTSAANALKGLIDSGYATHQFDIADLYSGLSPNYDFQLKQGQGATNAVSNLSGGLLGGNALRGLQNYTQDYAGNAYQAAFNNYQNQRNSIFGNVQPVANMGLDATKSVGTLYANKGNNLASLATGYGMNSANNAVGLGTSTANLDTGYGSTGANLYANQGNAVGQTAIGVGNANAAGTLGQYDAYGNAIANAGNSALTGYTLSKLINPTASGGNLYTAGGLQNPSTYGLSNSGYTFLT
jgi:hypothetical protein